MAGRSHVEKEGGGWKKAKFLLLASLEKGSQKGKKEGAISPIFVFFGEQGNGVLFCAPTNIVPYPVRTLRFNSLHKSVVLCINDTSGNFGLFSK